MYITFKEIKDKLKYIYKEQKTIKSDLINLKENPMLFLKIKNAVLKLKPQRMDLSALIKYFQTENWISMHIVILGVTTGKIGMKYITFKLVEEGKLR